MKCKVLNEERWKRLLHDELTAEESLAIREHLDTECPDCEEFLANIQMDAEVNLSRMRDDLLDQGAAGDPGSVKRDIGPTLTVTEGSHWSKPTAPRHYLTPWMGGIAALLIITIGILPQLDLFQPGSRDVTPAGFEKAKGIGVSDKVFKLDFSTGHRRQDGHLVIERGQPGGKYRDDNLLFFQYEASTTGYLYLIGVEAGEGAKTLYPVEGAVAHQVMPGEYSVSSHDEVIAYPMSGLHGRYTVVGIFSPKPLEMDDRAIRNTVQKSLNPKTGTVDKNTLKSINGEVAVDVVQFEIGT